MLKKARLLCRLRRNGRSRTSEYVSARLQLGFAHPDPFEQAAPGFLRRFVDTLNRPRSMRGQQPVEKAQSALSAAGWQGVSLTHE